MTYFSRRNEYVVEYSGHEEVSKALRARLIIIFRKFVEQNDSFGGGEVWSVEPGDLYYKVQQEFIGKDPFVILEQGEFHEVFTVVEIFLDLASNIYDVRKRESIVEIVKAFHLSGSVYSINEKKHIALHINGDAVEKIDLLKTVLAPYPEFHDRFYQAVGNLVGRRSKPEDVVKDVFVAVEGYLKAITGTSRFGEAIKYLSKNNLINKEQKKVLDALHEFRSDADGAGHAGNSLTPTEETALWFLDTIVAQVRMISKVIKK